jgi:tensin
MGCAPYLQIFKGGNLLHTSAACLHVQQSEEELPFIQVMDGTIPFNINQIIQGDILIRCRHLTFGKKRVSMFRAAFHTGYAPPNVLRLTKKQLDGACHDKRYPDDFFLDLIFEKVDPDDIAKLDKEKEESNATVHTEMVKGEKGKGPVVKASSVDTMLEGDSRFWDIIASKKQEHVKQANGDPFWGPTVGRRRGDSVKGGAKDKNEKSDNEIKTKDRNQLETFSIGNEFDFLPVTETAKTKEPPKRDSLMDALNALDEEEGQGHTEEIVFNTLDPSSNVDPPKPIFNDEMNAANADSRNDDSVQGEVEKSVDAATTIAPTAAAAKPEDSAVVEDFLDDEEGIDALLASADEDFGDLDLADFDDDDDLEDLENMLKT